MKNEGKWTLFENWNVEITPIVLFGVLFSPCGHIIVRTGCTARNNYIRGISNEERRRMMFQNQFFNNIPIENDRL